ncbi:lipopolysaccharide export LptBFGC system permease protein LptF [Chryseobacterium ginsenosidimutans]|uniref:hypothetical protein n=1 Tax=Chryseobacterium ginsenosidimutans TaxID=687846 RepID=UPI002786F892|nr:hypothetical protein [Chryseobacterium ginsenosidimutans]MDQ0594695.1 lipopolysaccharide export LptBFGC system permease protein LptF [Chryseobacterium ginsenosidimutans]
MAEKNSEKTFSYYLDEISKLAESLKTFPDGSVSDNASTIDRNVIELRKALKGIRIMLIFMTTITFISFLFALIILSSSKIRSYLADENTALKDSLLSIDKNNSYITYRTDKGKIITYQALIKENDSLNLRISKVESDLSLSKSDLELCQLKLKFAQGDVKQYKESADFFEEMHDKRSKEDRKEIMKDIQNLTKVDSGRILLDVFRKNMKYDSKTKSWTIDLNRK